MKIKGREYLEENVEGGYVILSLKPGGFTVKVKRRRLEAWLKSDAYIQNALPELNADEREFLVSGMDPGQFDKLFPPTGG